MNSVQLLDDQSGMSGEDKESLRATLSAKGYDLVDQGSDSDSDGGLPGRLPSLPPAQAKEKGNEAFKKGKYDKAIRYWQGGLKSILSSLCSGPEALKDQTLSELDLTLNLNIAMAYTKKEDFDRAEASVNKALARREALPPQLVSKALYRKANAQRSMNKLEEAMETLKDMLEVEPDHKAGQQMFNEIDREWKRQGRVQKAHMQKLFSKLGHVNKKEVSAERELRCEARRQCGVKWLEGDLDTALFEQGDIGHCTESDWGQALTRSVLWSIEQFAVEGQNCLPASATRASLWFLGCSSTCELRWLQPSVLMARLPAIVHLEIVMIGFMGELDPENKKIPDPKDGDLPVNQVLRTTLDEGRRSVSVRVVQGYLKDALQGDMWPVEAALQKQTKREGGTAVEEDDEVKDEPAADAEEGRSASSTAVPSTDVDTGDAAASSASSAADLSAPTVCFVAHPQLHRYFTDFHPAISWLIEHQIPTAVVGASEPDHSWKQDEILLERLGVQRVVGKRLSPYPMCLPDNPAVRKCNHVMGFRGGKAVAKDNLTKVKLNLLAEDYTVR